MRTKLSVLVIAAFVPPTAATTDTATIRFWALPAVLEVPATIKHPNERNALFLEVKALKKRGSKLEVARAVPDDQTIYATFATRHADALSRGADMNPFAGALSRDQTVRLDQ